MKPNDNQSISKPNHVTIKPLPSANNSAVVSRQLPPPPSKPQPPSQPKQRTPSNDQDLSETEILKNRVAQLQLQNQELQTELKKADRSLYDELEEDQLTIEKTEEDVVQKVKLTQRIQSDEFDEYFHLDKSSSSSSNIDSIKDGITSCDISNLIINSHHDGYEYSDANLYERQENAMCQLRRVRSMQDKSNLLQELKHSPDAAMAVILWCEQTLNFHNLMSLLTGADNAQHLEAYIGHLKRIGDTRQLSLTYGHFNMIREETLMRMKSCLTRKSLSEKSRTAQECSQFISNSRESIKSKCNKNSLFDISHYHQTMVDQSNLLQLQSRIDELDSHAKDPIFQQYKRSDISGTTLSNSLQYCLFYHPYATETKVASAQSMAKSFALSEHRYFYEAVHTRARIGDWTAVKSLYQNAKKKNMCYMSSLEYRELHNSTGVSGFLKKKLVTGTKDSYSVLAVNNFITDALMYNAPSLFVEFLLNELNDPLERFHLAKKRHVWHVAIKCVAYELKDKEMLQQLRLEILNVMSAHDSMQLRNEIDQLLHGDKIKWKKSGSGGGWFG
ncbi:hypothetical protein AKO1_004031 [Acrasis kona]|uniref:Uncharacterized protein n=1 Tax=Acrasis kona TaxID=1008807 RepID=A0AAW2ZQP0_9EUKA